MKRVGAPDISTVCRSIMAGSSFARYFALPPGASHGPAIGVVVGRVPPRPPRAKYPAMAQTNAEAGPVALRPQRQEPDQVKILRRSTADYRYASRLNGMSISARRTTATSRTASAWPCRLHLLENTASAVTAAGRASARETASRHGGAVARKCSGPTSHSRRAGSVGPHAIDAAWDWAQGSKPVHRPDAGRRRAGRVLDEKRKDASWARSSSGSGGVRPGSASRSTTSSMATWRGR